LQAQPPRGHVLTPDDMARSVDIMRNRIDKLGVSEPVVTKQGKDQIVIELPAVHNINQAAAIIGETAQLELYDLETSLVPPSIDASQNPVSTTSLYGLLTGVQSGQKGLPTQYYLFNSRTQKPAAGPAPGVTYYYLFKHTSPDATNPVPQMTGNDLKLKGTQQDFDPSSGSPIVTMQFKSRGNKIFHDITRQEAIRGQTLGTPQHFAIVLDNQIRSWPQIEYQKYPDGIDPTNGGAEITGMAGPSEANN